LDVVESYSNVSKSTAAMFEDLQVTDGVETRTRLMDAHNLLLGLTTVNASTAGVVPPGYYMVPGLECNVITTRLYGTDVKKCVEELQRHPEVIKGLSSSDTREIVAMLLNEYNLLNASVIGATFSAHHEESLTKASLAYPSIVSNWAEQVQQKIRIGSAKLALYAELLNELKPSSLHFVMVDSFHDMEDKVAKDIASQLITAIKATSRKLDSSKYQSDMLKRVTAPQFRVMEDEMLQIEGGDMQTAKASIYPVTVGGRRKWEIMVNPCDSDRWDVDDFVSICNRLLNKTGTSSKTISSITLPSYMSTAKCNRVLDEVRNGGIRRASREFTIMN